MERRKFIKACCYSAVSLPAMTAVLQSCGAIYYASSTHDSNKITVARSEFWMIKKDEKVKRTFVLINTEDSEFPICLYNTEEDNYLAVLLECTHKGCELNVGGGIYSCPCHGSEFTIAGQVLEGPAEENLRAFTTSVDDENIYVNLS
jgi:cytochrome b6-f complex iron-sulfur subunit